MSVSSSTTRMRAGAAAVHVTRTSASGRRFPGRDTAVKCRLRGPAIARSLHCRYSFFARLSPARVRVAFRLGFFPRDEQFFELFNQMADEIRAAAGLLEEMLATEPPDAQQGRPHQGRRAPLRRADARHDSAAAPHVRHAVRSRGSLRAGDVARQRHGRDRPRRRAGAALPDRRRPAGRARAGAHRLALGRAPARGARGAGGEEAGAAARGRDQPARERGRPRVSGGGPAALRHARPIRS